MGEASKFICDFHQELRLFRLANDFHYEPVFSLTCKLTALHEGNPFSTPLDGETVDDPFGRVAVDNRPVGHQAYRVQSLLEQTALRGYLRLRGHHPPYRV